MASRQVRTVKNELGLIKRGTKTYEQPNHDFFGSLLRGNYKIEYTEGFSWMGGHHGGSGGEGGGSGGATCATPRAEKDNVAATSSTFKKIVEDNCNKAIGDFGKEIQINPNNAEALNSRGLAYLRKGNCEYAWAFVREEYVVKEYNKAIADYKLAVLDFTAAIEIYRQKMKENLKGAELGELKLKCAEALNNCGLALFKQGKYDEAVKNYAEAIRLNPDEADAYMNLGKLYFKAEYVFIMATGGYTIAIANFTKAIEIYEKKMKETKNNVKLDELKEKCEKAYRNRAAANENLGKHNQAIKDYNKADEIAKGEK